ncbi:MAG: ArnT family glycosyltransferase [Verrucomicrobiales bacterium]
MTQRFLFFGLLFLLTLVRFWATGGMELAPDEAYYRLWSERLDWSYYSKGPGVAFAIAAGTALAGVTELGVRFLSPLLAFGSSLLVYALVRQFHSVGAAAWTVVVLAVLPIFSVGGLIMTIDPLSIFFWLAAFLTTVKATQSGRWYWWLGTGLLIGIGFLCKYTNAFQLLSVLLVMLVLRRQRPQIWRGGLFLVLLGFALTCWPPIIWNAEHNWITVTHLAERSAVGEAVDRGWDPWQLPIFIGLHAGVYSPLVFLGFVVALVWCLQRAQHQIEARVSLCFVLPILATYSIISIFKAGEANWTLPGMVTLGLFAVPAWLQFIERHGAWRWPAAAALALALLMSASVVNTDFLRALGAPWPYERDPSTRLRAWQSSSEALALVREEFEKRLQAESFLIANKYGTAAALEFYLPTWLPARPGHPKIYTPGGPSIQNQYAFWGRYDEHELLEGGVLPAWYDDRTYTEEMGVNLFEGRTALFVTDEANPEFAGLLKWDDEGDGPAPWAESEQPDDLDAELSHPYSPISAYQVRRSFEWTQPLADVLISRRDQPIRMLRIFACFRYRVPDL